MIVYWWVLSFLQTLYFMKTFPIVSFLIDNDHKNSNTKY